MDKFTEFLACAECDSEQPIGKTRGGEDSLFVCHDCGTVEGRTHTLWANDETEEAFSVASILEGAAELEDGETGIHRCVELYCEQMGIPADIGEIAVKEFLKRAALSSGIPLSVIEGKTKLSDHFSPDYIRMKCRGGK